MPSTLEKLEKDATEHKAATLERIDYLDGWRGLAIALVLQEHFFKIKGISSGRLGVDIFFCLSGLLMAKLLFVKQTPLKLFYARRISRIIPVFLLYVFTVYLIAYFVGKPIDVTEIFSTVAFLRTYYPQVPNIWQQFTVPTGHLWSLNIEEHCYVLMSLFTLIAFLKKREGITMICIGISTIVLSIFYTTHLDLAPDLYIIRTECSASFLMISAGYSLVKCKFDRFVTPVMPVATFVVAVCSYCTWFPIKGFSVFLAPFLLSFTVNHLSVVWNGIHKLLCFTPLRLLGCWSYSIYLWQQPFHTIQNNMYPGVAFVLAMIVSLTSFYCFENPIRTWLNEKKYLILFERYLKIKVVQSG